MGKHLVSRKSFSDEDIAEAMTVCEGNKTLAAKYLTRMGRGEVSRELLRYWLKQGRKRAKKNCRTSMSETTGAEARSAANAAGTGTRPAEGGPRILILDIETSPIEGRVWGLWNQNLGLNQITKEWNILSYCAKWLGDPNVIYSDLSQAENIADDSKLVAELYELLNEADLVVAQNGKRFDLPKIQARFVMAGYKPPRPFRVVDTMLMAKQQFGFTSNKLEWMTDKLCTTKKRKHEKFPGMELWNQCLAGNPEAWEEMRLYNIDDVISLEELYLILRPWYQGHPNVAVFTDSEEPACPKCGSHELKRDGWTFTQSGKYELYHCGSCGGYSRGRYTKNSKEVRHAQLSN